MDDKLKGNVEHDDAGDEDDQVKQLCVAIFNVTKEMPFDVDVPLMLAVCATLIGYCIDVKTPKEIQKKALADTIGLIVSVSGVPVGGEEGGS